MAIPFFWIALVASCLYALIRGGAPERIGAVIFILAVLVTPLAASSMQGKAFRTPELGLLLIDAAMLIAFLALTLTSSRFWPIWMSGLQAVQVAGHLARLADPGLIYWAYGVAQGLWSYPMMALLAAATWRHRERLRRFGVDNAWRNSSRRSAPSPGGPGRTG